MSVWLFEDLDIKDPKVDFQRFKVLLREAIGEISGALYFPMIFFEQEKRVWPIAEAYQKKFEELRKRLLDQCTLVGECVSVPTLGEAANAVYVEVDSIYDDLIFVLATMPEKYQWIGSCDINKTVRGVLQCTVTEMSSVMHVLKHLEKQCISGEVK